MVIVFLPGRRQVRGLAHPAHWQGPQGALFERFGAVKATPRAVFKLLQSGEAVLLFPGGGREARPHTLGHIVPVLGVSPEPGVSGSAVTVLGSCV